MLSIEGKPGASPFSGLKALCRTVRLANGEEDRGMLSDSRAMVWLVSWSWICLKTAVLTRSNLVRWRAMVSSCRERVSSAKGLAVWRK